MHAGRLLLIGLIFTAAPAFADSTATPQRPDALARYRVRPNWKVAGVDYAVGIAPGALLKAPGSIIVSGVSVDPPSKYIGVSRSNVVLDGYDFSGWEVELLAGASNLTIKNSKFLASGTRTQSPIYAYWGGFITVVGNTIDGGGVDGAANPLVTVGRGGARIERNYFVHVPNDAINISHDGRFMIKYNLFDSLNYGDFHTDCVQTFFSAVSQLDVEYNTVFQPPPEAFGFPGGGNSFVRVGDEKGNDVKELKIAHNTLIYRGIEGVKFANVFDISAGGGKVANPRVYDNYIDPGGVIYGVWSPYAAELTAPIYYGNINVLMGKPILASRYNNQFAGVPSRPPAAPVIIKVVFGGSTVAISGVAPPGSMVSVIDAADVVKATKADANGNWTLAAETPGYPAFPIVARAADELGNASSASPAWTAHGTRARL